VTGALLRSAAAVTVSAIVALSAAGCGGSPSPMKPDNPGGVIISGVHQDTMFFGAEPPRPYRMPDVTLTATNGAPFNLVHDTVYKVTLVFFGYTNCPDVCPTTMADIAVALRSVGPELAKQVQVVFVTTDPKRDTTARLAEWLGRFDADLPTKFIGLTGSQQVLDQAQLSAGVPVAQDGGQTHSALLLLYGADDKAHVAFDAGNSPKDIAHDLKLVAIGT
jgi:protein SCO1